MLLKARSTTKNSLNFGRICDCMKKRNLLLPAFLLLGSSLVAQTSAPKYSNEFLSIGVSAAAMGMSNSVVASVNDVTAGYWNPAGLMSIEPDLQLGIMHAEYFAGIAKYDYGSVAVPLREKNAAVAFTVLRFGVDDIPNTLFLVEPDGSINYDNITAFSVADYAFMGSYARKLKWKDLRVGATAKVVHREAGSFATAWGFGIDAGAQMDLNKWKFGVQLRDITSTFNAWSFSFTEEEKEVLTATGNTIPENSLEITTPKIILGASYTQPLGQKFGLMGEINADLSTDGRRNVLLSADPISVDPHLGLEANYQKFIFVRAGIGNVQRYIPDDLYEESWTAQPNVGLGLVIGPVRLDYAYSNIGKQAEVLYSHIFSLRFDVNKNEKPASK